MSEPVNRSLEEMVDSKHENVLEPIRIVGASDQYKYLYDDKKDYTFIKLLEAINMKALDFPVNSKLPRMDLSALYCLGATVQEYARYLGTDLLTEKRATENLEPLNTLLDQQEIESQQLLSIINAHKPIRPKLHAEVNKSPSYYEQMLRSPAWENTLKWKRNKEIHAAAATVRRERDDIVNQKDRLERALKREGERQQVGEKRVKTEYILPPTPPQDMFDVSRQTSKSTKPLRKKRKNANPF